MFKTVGGAPSREGAPRRTARICTARLWTRSLVGLALVGALGATAIGASRADTALGGAAPHGGGAHATSSHGASVHGGVVDRDLAALMDYARDVGLEPASPHGRAGRAPLTRLALNVDIAAGVPGDPAAAFIVARDASQPAAAGHHGGHHGGGDIVVAQAAAPKAPVKPKPTAAAAGPKAKMVRPAPDDPEGRYYVGMEPCKVCHAGLFDEFAETVMGRNIKSGLKTAQGVMECETCHGPASGHVNEGGGRGAGHIRSFRKTDERFDIAEVNGVCLTCHEKGNQTYWPGSTHENRSVACVDCHTVMRKVTPRFQLAKATVMDTCFQCHKDRRAQIYRTSHMPVREGKVTCASCHNPHGSANEKLLKEATINDTCYQCHADKRGPFLFEHAPVRESCVNCHEPHGTMHPNLLIVMRERLCQRCHTNPHNQAGLMIPGQTGGNLRYEVGSSCQNCHTNIHGSNSPSGSRWHR